MENITELETYGTGIRKGSCMSALVEVRDICKVYNPGENELRALDHVSLTINK